MFLVIYEVETLDISEIMMTVASILQTLNTHFFSSVIKLHPDCLCLFYIRYLTKNQPPLRLEKHEIQWLVMVLYLFCGRTSYPL